MGDRRGKAALIALTMLAVAACAPLGPPPYETPSPIEATATSDGDGFTHAERIALRVWATTCTAYRNGSAWMLDETHAVTNRHVVEGAETLELTDYQGRSYGVTSAAYSTKDDLALITIDGSFPESGTIAAREPRRGDALTVTGFALGGPLEATTGPLVERTENALDRDGARIYFIELLAREGSSGSPVTDAAGDVVGVLFSSNQENFAGAVTLKRLKVFLEDDAPRTKVDASC